MDMISSAIYEDQSEKIVNFIEILKQSLITAGEAGLDIKREKERMEKLMIEVNTLSEILKTLSHKALEANILSYDVLFKFYPQLTRPLDYQIYQELTGEKIEPKRRDSQAYQPEELLKEDTALLKNNFQCQLKDWPVDELFNYLLIHDYIDHRSNKASFQKIFELQGISKDNRILWIDKSETGKVNNRTLVRLIYNAFLYKSNKVTHGRLTMSYLVTHYFKVRNGELKPKTLNVIFSRIKNQDSSSERERKIEEVMYSLQKKYPMGF